MVTSLETIPIEYWRNWEHPDFKMKDTRKEMIKVFTYLKERLVVEERLDLFKI